MSSAETPVIPTPHARPTAPSTTLAVPLIPSDTTLLQLPLALFLNLLPLPLQAPTLSTLTWVVLLATAAARASQWQLLLFRFQKHMDWRFCWEACLLGLLCYNWHRHSWEGNNAVGQVIDCSCGIADNICLVCLFIGACVLHLNSVMRTGGKFVMRIT